MIRHKHCGQKTLNLKICWITKVYLVLVFTSLWTNGFCSSETSHGDSHIVSSSLSIEGNKNPDLHEKDCFIGKLCEYKIPERIFQCKAESYMISQGDAERSLPRWLWFNEENQTLIGVPFDGNDETLEILIVGLGATPDDSRNRYICGSIALKISIWGLKHFPLFAVNSLLGVRLSRERSNPWQPITCGVQNPILFASIVFNNSVNFNDLNGKHRYGFLEKLTIASQLEISKTFVLPNTTQNPFSTLLESSNIVASGPGLNGSAGQTKRGITLAWFVKCGVIHMDDPLFDLLKELSQKRFVANEHAVIGWYITTGFQRHIQHNVVRRRRNVAAKTTPVITSTISVSGTSISTTRLKPTQSTSTVLLTRPQPTQTFSPQLASTTSSYDAFSSPVIKIGSTSQQTVSSPHSSILHSPDMQSTIVSQSVPTAPSPIQPSFTTLVPQLTTMTTRYGLATLTLSLSSGLNTIRTGDVFTQSLVSVTGASTRRSTFVSVTSLSGVLLSTDEQSPLPSTPSHRFPTSISEIITMYASTSVDGPASTFVYTSGTEQAKSASPTYLLSSRTNTGPYSSLAPHSTIGPDLATSQHLITTMVTESYYSTTGPQLTTALDSVIAPYSTVTAVESPTKSNSILESQSTDTSQVNITPHSTVGAQSTFHPHSTIVPQSTFDPHSTVAPQSTLDPHSPVAPQSTLDPHSTVAPQSTLDPHSTVEPQSTLDPHSPVAPQSTLDPHSTVAPQSTLDPHSPVAPQSTLDPHSTVVPQSTLDPHSTVVPQSTLGPHSPVAPQSTLDPHSTVAPQSTLDPHSPVAPQSTLDPHSTVVPQSTLDPHSPVAPQSTLDPHSTVAPQSTLDPYSTVASQSTLDPHSTTGSQSTFDPHSTVGPQPTIDPHSTVAPQSTFAPHSTVAPQSTLDPHSTVGSQMISSSTVVLHSTFEQYSTVDPHATTGLYSTVSSSLTAESHSTLVTTVVPHSTAGVYTTTVEKHTFGPRSTVGPHSKVASDSTAGGLQTTVGPVGPHSSIASHTTSEPHSTVSRDSTVGGPQTTRLDSTLGRPSTTGPYSKVRRHTTTYGPHSTIGPILPSGSSFTTRPPLMSTTGPQFTSSSDTTPETGSTIAKPHSPPTVLHSTIGPDSTAESRGTTHPFTTRLPLSSASVLSTTMVPTTMKLLSTIQHPLTSSPTTVYDVTSLEASRTEASLTSSLRSNLSTPSIILRTEKLTSTFLSSSSASLIISTSIQTYSGLPSLATMHFTISLQTMPSRTISPQSPSSTVIPWPTVPPDSNSPKVYNSFDVLRVRVGEIFHVQIPIDTFHDREDGNTRNLTLSCTDANHKPLTNDSWLQFNARTQTLYGITLESQVEEIRESKNEYLLIARDSAGNEAYDAFAVSVQEQSEILTVKYTLKILNIDLQTFNQDISNILLLVRKIADHYGDSDTSYVQVLSLQSGSVLFTWSNNTVRTCDKEEINELSVKIATSEGNIQPSFHEALLPEFPVNEIYVNETGACVPTEAPSARELYGQDDDKLWLKYFIPGLVIAIIVIIIAVTCFVVRRHTGVKVLRGDKRTFKRRKPVILDDEREMDTLSGKPVVELPEDSLTPAYFPEDTFIYDDEDDLPQWLSPIAKEAPPYTQVPPKYKKPDMDDDSGSRTPPPPYKMPPSYYG